ncbi:E3 ubiquitin/ISG15 ligase TRIM25 isoform 2-T2 [Pholidichthys leucotaenia]
MAEVDVSQLSLMGLEEELTCSICLSPFDCPVTIPCGHNFCQDCLLASWKDSYSCPQCRTFFATKPELKKNTVLTTVVETFILRSSKREETQTKEESKVEKKVVIQCDTCMAAEASKTCLTCMASYCEEHLRPHQENPVFRLHQLTEPVEDLLERICPDHHKPMELFCSNHGTPICSFCLQLVHKGCSFVTPEEQRNLKECELRGNLTLLDGKIEKNEAIISQMKDMQNKLKDSATTRKKALSAEYQQIQNMLIQEERDALNAVDHDLENSHVKIRGFMTKFSENIENMKKASEDINHLLSQSQTLAFLQASPQLPQAANFNPHTPKISLASKNVLASEAFVGALKNHLKAILKQPVEARLPLPEHSERAGLGPAFKPPVIFVNPPQFAPPSGWAPPLRFPISHNPGPLAKADKKKEKKPTKSRQKSTGEHMRNKNTGQSMENLLECWKEQTRGCPPASEPKEISEPRQKSTGEHMGNKNTGQSMENLLDCWKEQTRGCPPASEPKEISDEETMDIPRDITSAEKRSELLKYGTILQFSPRTAHRRIALTESNTKASVSEVHLNYGDCPERFAVCSQVLATKCFSTGRHYWEVRLSCNNFIGVGLTYGSIDRKGPTSRLGRNSQSWCIEWFNVKLSAWHNGNETVLVNSSPKRVGVLLDCEAGTATFYNVADRAYPFHTFVFPFAEPVYPAFWIFSSGSSISLCKLQ